jgi:hypothetical protein
MDIAIYVVALVFLGVMSTYALSTGFGSLRRSAIFERSAGLQQAVLKARLQQIMDERNAEREKHELSWNGFRKFEIKRKVVEGGDICSFYFAPHDKKPLPPFKPGQYLTFQLTIAGQAKPIIRCYSLSDSPRYPEHYRCTIKAVPAPRDKPEVPPGLSSNFFHQALDEGDIIDIKAPGGHFFLDTTKQTPVVLIGGGIGLTPLLSMLNTIVESGAKRETWFFYGVRNGKEHIMKEHFAKLRQVSENIHLCICYSNPEPTDVIGRTYDHAERVSVALFKRLLPSSNYDFYLCGPPPMMNGLVADLETWGVPEKHIHFEAFGPASVKKTAAVATSAATSTALSAGISVSFAKSNVSAIWNPALGSLLELAEAHQVTIDSGCRAGNCGTCITAIKEGEVSYLQEPGTMPEAGSCLTCVSVPKGNLILNA